MMCHFNLRGVEVSRCRGVEVYCKTLTVALNCHVSDRENAGPKASTLRHLTFGEDRRARDFYVFRSKYYAGEGTCMEGLSPIEDATLPDIFLNEQPYQITEARTYFRLKHLAGWGATITLHPWDTWERLGDRVAARLTYHLWHPSHWDAYYAALPDVPASTPGAVPLTMAMVREQRRTAEAQLHFLEEDL